MVTLKDFTMGGTYPPIQHSARLTRIANNRKLYNNELRPYIEQTETSSVKLNLFRKAIEVYTNFLLSEGVQVNFNQETEFDKRNTHLVEVLYLVNTDSKRYGVGVVSLDQETGLFKVYEPDQWYQILSKAGDLTAEVLVEYSNNPLEIQKNTASNSQHFSWITITTNDYLKNIQTVEIRKLQGGKIGELEGDPKTLPIIGRQVAPLFTGYAKGQEGVSVFDDIKDIIIDMVRIKQNLSKSLEKNSRPHLAAPATILKEDENGKVNINSEGMLLPLSQGDAAPFYLQWDTNAEAAKFQMEEHWKGYFALTSIPRMVFEPSLSSQSSGTALKRMLFPFISSLNKLQVANIGLIKQLLVMYDNYLLANGLPRLPTVTPEIILDYNKIFEDDGVQPAPIKIF